MQFNLDINTVISYYLAMSTKTIDSPMHLVQFSVENYRSIREKLTLSLVASPKHDKRAVFESRNTKLLTGVVVYGANASGKSNVLRALFAASGFIRGRYNIFDDANSEVLVPYLLDDYSKDKDSFFETVFTFNNKTFVHGFHASSSQKRVTREWLRVSDNESPRPLMVFEREDDNLRLNTNVPISTHGISRKFTKQIAPKELFVTTLSRLAANTVAKEVVEAWSICSVLNTLVHGDTDLTADFLKKMPYQKERLLELIQEAGIDIIDLEVKEQNNNLKLYAIHQIYDKHGKPAGRISFDVDKEESAGTRKFLSFASYVVVSLTLGAPTILDELSSNLHPRLMNYIISLFMNPLTNPEHAQIVTTLHDTSQMELFARDQIYFTEKSKHGATKLYSLAEFKGIRKNSPNLEKRYLEGEFGATPKISEY